MVNVKLKRNYEIRKILFNNDKKCLDYYSFPEESIHLLIKQTLMSLIIQKLTI